jgi:hypothetical protein
VEEAEAVDGTVVLPDLVVELHAHPIARLLERRIEHET